MRRETDPLPSPRAEIETSLTQTPTPLFSKQVQRQILRLKMLYHFPTTLEDCVYHMVEPLVSVTSPHVSTVQRTWHVVYQQELAEHVCG